MIIYVRIRCIQLARFLLLSVYETLSMTIFPFAIMSTGTHTHEHCMEKWMNQTATTTKPYSKMETQTYEMREMHSSMRPFIIHIYAIYAMAFHFNLQLFAYKVHTTWHDFPFILCSVCNMFANKTFFLTYSVYNK